MDRAPSPGAGGRFTRFGRAKSAFRHRPDDSSRRHWEALRWTWQHYRTWFQRNRQLADMPPLVTGEAEPLSLLDPVPSSSDHSMP